MSINAMYYDIMSKCIFEPQTTTTFLRMIGKQIKKSFAHHKSLLDV